MIGKWMYNIHKAINIMYINKILKKSLNMLIYL